MISHGPIGSMVWYMYNFDLPPHPATVTTRIITFLVGNPYSPSFVTVIGCGVDHIHN